MRNALFLLALCACASTTPGAPLPPTRPTIRPAPADPVPAAARAAERHVVAVYVEQDCATLDQATNHGTGYYVAPDIVATADHAMWLAKSGAVPSFAIVGEDGCREARYADRMGNDRPENPEEDDAYDPDILFLHVLGPPHEGFLTLAKRTPKDGERLYRYAVRGVTGDGRPVFGWNAFTMERLGISKVFFAGRAPLPEEGESGGPVFGADGLPVGMTLAHARRKDTGRRVGIYVSSLAVWFFLKECSEGGPCGDGTPP